MPSTLQSRACIVHCGIRTGVGLILWSAVDCAINQRLSIFPPNPKGKRIVDQNLRVDVHRRDLHSNRFKRIFDKGPLILSSSFNA